MLGAVGFDGSVGEGSGVRNGGFKDIFGFSEEWVDSVELLPEQTAW